MRRRVAVICCLLFATNATAEPSPLSGESVKAAVTGAVIEIETPLGVLEAGAIARSCAGLIAGTNDLGKDLGIPSGSGRAGLHHSLQQIVLAARAAGIAAFDGVYNRVDDEEGLAAECREGRSFGFDGKSVIHPGQITTANRLFGPSPEELAEAEALIAAASGGAERWQGRMIEDLHVAQARAILARGRR